ncbi:MAG: DMT family transporter [Clostridia bacterium]|nr:DMT family transporter [Clostridia bacterium]
MTNDSQQKKYKLEFLIVMCSFGILGPIVKAIGFPSPVIAFFRASIAGISLAIYYFARNKRVDKATRKRCFIPLIICGICLAGDWITLFTAYNYTTVATATICYYIEPILVLIGSGIFLKEKIRTKHLICIIVAFIGVAFVSGIEEKVLEEETGNIQLKMVCQALRSVRAF